MSYDIKTIDGVRRRLKQAPGDLEVTILLDGLCYPINRIRTAYAIPTKDWSKQKCFMEVGEDERGAVQIMLIE